MQFKRGFARKAQEGLSLPALGALLLVIIVVVLLILGLTGALNPIFDKFNLLPGSGIAGLVTACETYVQLESQSDYCAFKEVKVDGRTEYVNCEDSRVQQDIKTQSDGVLECNNADAAIKAKCVSLIKAGEKNNRVNGRVCAADFSLSCTPDLGSAPDAGGDCAANQRLVTGYNTANEKCCVSTQ